MSECIEWTGNIGNHGYGRYSQQMVHRLAWTIVHGEIPEGMQVLHHCDNPICFNVNHLFLGTNADNIRDKVSKGRQIGRMPKGEDNHNSKLTERQVRKIRELRLAGWSLPKLGEKFGVSHPSISAIVHRRTWRHI
jgi:hypothetical protein